MIKNVYRNEGANEYFVQDAKEVLSVPFMLENCHICSIDNLAIVSRKGGSYTFLGDFSLVTRSIDIDLNNDLIRIYSQEGTEIAEFYADKLVLKPGGEIIVSNQDYSNSLSMKKDFVIAI